MMNSTLKKILFPLVDSEEELEVWWITPNEGLDGRTPAELFDKIPLFAKTMAKSFLSTG